MWEYAHIILENPLNTEDVLDSYVSAGQPLVEVLLKIKNSYFPYMGHEGMCCS